MVVTIRWKEDFGEQGWRLGSRDGAWGAGMAFGEQAGWRLGSRDGAVVRALASHQCGPGSIPSLGVICGLSLLLVLVLAPRGFSPGTPVFPSPQKPTFPNSNSIWTQWNKSHLVDPLLIPIYFLFIYLFIYFVFGLRTEIFFLIHSLTM